MRLSADGQLFPCLLDSRSVDLRPLLSTATRPGALRATIQRALAGKKPSGSTQTTPMVQLGG
jgi:molybdenum cofactor biosynthesis enzyme MoaA